MKHPQLTVGRWETLSLAMSRVKVTNTEFAKALLILRAALAKKTVAQNVDFL